MFQKAPGFNGEAPFEPFLAHNTIFFMVKIFNIEQDFNARGKGRLSLQYELGRKVSPISVVWSD